MVAGEALGRTRERIAFELHECPSDGGLLEEFSERLVTVEQPVADLGELLLLRHIGAGGDDHFFGADMEVVAGTRGFLQTLMRPPRGYVGFVRTLV